MFYRAGKISVMQVVKWGNSLAVRLSAKLVREFDLKEGDEVDIRPDGTGWLVVSQRVAAFPVWPTRPNLAKRNRMRRIASLISPDGFAVCATAWDTIGPMRVLGTDLALKSRTP